MNLFPIHRLFLIRTILLHPKQKQPLGVFYKKAVLKNFAMFTEKHLCWSLFLIKLQVSSPNTVKYMKS